MKIGFDAKRLFWNQTGLGNYSRNLVQGVCMQFPQHSYVLYTPRVQTNEHTRYFLDTCSVVQAPYAFASSLWRSFGLVKSLEKQNIDIYHGLSHELPFGIAKSKVKSVVTIHDFAFKFFSDDFPLFDRSVYNIKWRYACNHADAIVATSEATKADIIRYFRIPESKIHVIYQSCDARFSIQKTEEEKQVVRSTYHLPDTYILYVGSITARKNIRSLLRAYELCMHQINMPLVLCGNGGKYKREIEAEIIARNLQEHVLVRDSVAVHDLPALYQAAHVSVYPSLYEGFGIPVLEAIKSGTPVITSIVSCLPEVGGNVAIYCNPYSVESIAEALVESMSSEYHSSDFSRKLQEHAAQFSHEAFVEKNMSMYQNLI